MENFESTGYLEETVDYHTYSLSGLATGDEVSNNSRYDWVYRLCGAMLKQTARDVKRGNSEDSYEATLWVLDDDEDHILSFRNVCDVLGGNYKLIRKSILSLDDEE